jgi:protein TonB
MKTVRFACLALVLAAGQLLADDAPVSPTQRMPVEPVDQAAEIARLEAEIDRQQMLYGSGPKRKFIASSTKQPEYRAYMAEWVRQIEMVGREHYPPEARRLGLSGRVLATVSIARNGQLESVQINQSSGSKVLDDAVKDIVGLASPFAPIPAVDDIDFLEITRTWQFVNDLAPGGSTASSEFPPTQTPDK